VLFHTKLPMLQDCDGNFLPWFRKLVVVELRRRGCDSSQKTVSLK
jgi:hypothetical protein